MNAFVDVVFQICPVEKFAVGLLVLDGCDGKNGDGLVVSVFEASVEGEVRLESCLVEREVGYVGSVQVSGREPYFGVEVGVGLVKPSNAGSYYGVVGLSLVNVLVGVVEFYFVGVESRLAISCFRGEREVVVVASVEREVVADYEVSCGGSVVESACLVVVEHETQVESASVVGVAMEREFAGGESCLVGCANRGPLGAVGKCEAADAVEKAIVGGV